MTRRWQGKLAGATIIVIASGILIRVASAAETGRFLVSYGGTAGYQLPCGSTGNLGFSKKHGVDLETILIERLAQHSGAGRRQLAADANGGVVSRYRTNAGRGGDRGALENKLRCCWSPS
jgi:hypothetical protein